MALATVDDYAARYGAPGDEGRCIALLEDASAMVLQAYEGFYGEPYEAGARESFDRAAPAVCCLLVNRVLSAPAAMAGATQYSQGAGGYTASVTYGSALGEMFLGKTERKMLGLTGQRMGVIRPFERGEAT